MVKDSPAMQEIRVLSLGQEDPLEQEMTSHSSILAWRISWTEEPSGLQSLGFQESDTTEQLTLSLSKRQHTYTPAFYDLTLFILLILLMSRK